MYNFLDVLIAEAKADGKLSRARSYRSLQKSLVSVDELGDLPLTGYSAEAVVVYQQWLDSRELSPDTVSFYLRTLRAVLNHAHSRGLIDKPDGWFKDVNTKVDRSGSRSLEHTLDRATLQRLQSADLSSDPELDLARDIFLVGFYGRGMELSDIARLTGANLKGAVLEYRRRGEGALCRVPIGDTLRALITKYAGNTTGYLFPIITSGKLTGFAAGRNRLYNALQRLGELLAPGHRLSMRVARATWHSLMNDLPIAEALLNPVKVRPAATAFSGLLPVRRS